MTVKPQTMTVWVYLLVSDRELAQLARGIVPRRLRRKAEGLVDIEDQLRRNAARPERKRMAKAALRA